MQMFPTDVSSVTLTAEAEAMASHNTDPETLSELLQNAARSWPTHGIMFKDQGWDQVSDFVTYADLLRQAEVDPAFCKVR
jgi:hypothetical protein